MSSAVADVGGAIAELQHLLGLDGLKTDAKTSRLLRQ